ncbi:MAG: formate dehydrogenase accessory sulfurtransferase FdhD [Candidatus Adiutrix sp.]|jgi:molybdopterin-guanine dinucleotide biosynthesis protein A|nr:formate dehydrogenase accessory sulfurtransferase FdhD [Candidatus Adiutrix sp.]
MSGGLEQYGAAVFCGGRSRRMGADKALFLVDGEGRGLLAALAGELAGRFGQVILVTDDRRKLAAAAELRRFPQVEDLRPGSGPVGAILTALTHCPDRPVFVLACDMPVVNWAIVSRLKELLDLTGAKAALPRHGERPEPLCAFYGSGAASVFARGLAEGRLAVREHFPDLQPVFLDLPEPVGASDPAAAPFTNLNAVAEARRAGFSLLGLADRPVRRAGPDGVLGPAEERPAPAEISFDLVVDGAVILSQAALPPHLADLARGLLLARGVIRHAADLADLVVSENRRRVEVQLKHPPLVFPPAAGARPPLKPRELLDLVEEFEGRSSPWREAGVTDRAWFAAPGGAGPWAPVFEDLNPLAALDKAIGRLLISGDDPAGGLLLTSGRADETTVRRAVRAGAGGLIARLAPTTAAIDLARAAGLLLAAPIADALSVYAGAERLEPAPPDPREN